MDDLIDITQKIFTDQDRLILNEVRARFWFRDNLQQLYGAEIDTALKDFFTDVPQSNDSDSKFVFKDGLNWHRIFCMDFNTNMFTGQDPDATQIMQTYLKNIIEKKLNELGLSSFHYDLRSYNSISSILTCIGVCIYLTPYFYRDGPELCEKIKLVLEK